GLLHSSYYFFFLLLPPPPRSTLFPYTTLFRSGIAFIAGGLKNGVQQFESPRARTTASLLVLAAAILSIPTFAHELHAPAGAHVRTLSLICAGVLIVVFLATLPIYLAGDAEDLERPRWTLALTIAILTVAALGAV